jgi:hypothetical protein
MERLTRGRGLISSARDRGGSVSGRDARSVHFDAPPPTQLLVQRVRDPVTEPAKREFIGEVAPAPTWAGDDRPSEHKTEVSKRKLTNMNANRMIGSCEPVRKTSADGGRVDDLDEQIYR